MAELCAGRQEGPPHKADRGSQEPSGTLRGSDSVSPQRAGEVARRRRCWHDRHERQLETPILPLASGMNDDVSANGGLSWTIGP